MIQRVKTIQPAIFGDEVTAFFTLKNKSYKPNQAEIAGFNLGLNTKEQNHIIKANRQRLSEMADVDFAEVAYARQVHGSQITFVKEGGTVDNCDALITQTAGIALAIQVADCAAVLIYEPELSMIAAVHAGWRGAAANILPNAINEMKQHGADISSARAYISPCIGKDHFEVGREVADQFPAEFVDDMHYSKPHIDLKSFLHSQLLQRGLGDNNIQIDAGCTVADADSYYSYRREQEQSGRMMAVIKLPTG